jgi:hypothetical protein
VGEQPAQRHLFRRIECVGWDFPRRELCVHVFVERQDALFDEGEGACGEHGFGYGAGLEQRGGVHTLRSTELGDAVASGESDPVIVDDREADARYAPVAHPLFNGIGAVYLARDSSRDSQRSFDLRCPGLLGLQEGRDAEGQGRGESSFRNACHVRATNVWYST